MRHARAFIAFLWDFIVGEDPLLFACVWVGLGTTATVEALGIPSWWLLPVGVLLALAISVLRARPAT